jgi:hypothetical protein
MDAGEAWNPEELEIRPSGRKEWEIWVVEVKGKPLDLA